MTTRGLVVGLLAASMLLSGCVATVSGTAVRDGHAVPANVPPLDEAALKRVLLSIDEVNRSWAPRTSRSPARSTI